MKEIKLDELKKIQLDILEVIHDFCINNNIKYSMGCGTLLGAARHKGYIPWDDDVDIYMLREEYNKLIASFPEVVSDVKIASLERDFKWTRPYANAFDCRTLLKNAGEYGVTGVAIDIFPIDRVPEEEDEWIKYDKFRRRLQRIYELKSSMVYRRGRSVWKYCFLPFTKLLLLPFSKRCIGNYISSYAQRYNKTDSSLVFECVQGIFQKHRFNRSTLENVVDMPFEDRIFKGMANYEDYLSNAYGNWRELPPIEKQVSHHCFEAWWKA